MEINERGNMMADAIQINTIRLDRDADSISGYIGKINKSIESLEVKQRELDNMWDGLSSETLKRNLLRDIANMKEHVAVIKSIYEYEKNAKKEYESCETKVAQLIDSIKI